MYRGMVNLGYIRRGDPRMYKGRSAPVILGEVNPGCMRGGHMVF